MLHLDRVRVERREISGARRAVFTLPDVPSVNNLFLNVSGRGRVPTKRYSQWRAEAAAMLLTQKVRRIGGQVNIYLTFEERDKRRKDLDNKIKAPVDLLVHHGIIDGDDSRFVRRLVAAWGTCNGCEVEIVGI